MVVCPKCGSKLQYRRIIFLSNFNSITCQVCQSELGVKNKGVNSIIGALCGGVGGALMFLLFFIVGKTNNFGFLALFPIVMVTLLLGALLMVDKYVKVTFVRDVK
jgi:hypothetical protein